MPFNEFLKLCTTIRSLYCKEVAQAVFEKNVAQYYNLGNFVKKSENGTLQFEQLPI